MLVFIITANMIRNALLRYIINTNISFNISFTIIKHFAFYKLLLLLNSKISVMLILKGGSTIR